MKMKSSKKGNLQIVTGVVSFALFLGIMVFVFGILGSNLNDTEASGFFSEVISTLTGTVGIIGAVIVLSLVGIIFVVIPMFK
jgi:hypothetical protein